jgi:hypothetical protein
MLKIMDDGAKNRNLARILENSEDPRVGQLFPSLNRIGFAAVRE